MGTRAIHDLSSLATLSQFDLFKVPPTQFSVERDIEEFYRPIAPVDINTPIEFSILSGIDEYILLNETYLYFKLTVDIEDKADPTKAMSEANWKSVVPAQLLHASCFRNVTLLGNGKEITLSPSTYPYKAYFDTLFNSNEIAKRTHLTAAGWYMTRDKRSAAIRPQSVTSKSSTIELMGKLHLDLVNQDRALLGKVNLQIRLIPNDKDFIFEYPDTLNLSFKFSDVWLKLRKSKVTPELLEGHEAGLSQATAKYTIPRSEVTPHVLHEKTTDYLMNFINHDQIPDCIFVGFIKNSAFNGSKTENPFDLNDFGNNFFTTYLNGIPNPWLPFTPDYSNGNFTREYLNMYCVLNQNNNTVNLEMTKSEFKEHPILAVGFNPDLSNGPGAVGHSNLIKEGNLRLHFKFKEALANATTVLIYAVYNSMIEIDEFRNFILDYSK